jgi:hypothetical protein
MRAGGGEDAWYAPRVALRHVRGVAARNLRVPSANGERFANRDARDGDGFARDVAPLGTYCTLRPHRARGAVYAPTPYGEVCVDDDGEDEGDRFAAREAFASETARGERGLNPDWDVAIEIGRASERLGTRDGTKFELCVYGARADGREGARGGETAKAGSARASGARWRRGEGLRTTREGDAGGETTSDVLICRAAIDLTRLVRLGNRVPSGTAMPPNAVFLRLSDGGVYSPEPSAADASGRAVRAFIDAVRAKNEQNGGQHRRGASNGVAVIDRIITEDEEDERLGGGGRSRSPTTASASARAADKKSVVKVDVRAMVAKIENVIEAKSAEEDARDLRDELARRMQTRLGDFGGAAGICKKPAAASMANDDGITADERIVALTNELAEERESLALMKDDVGRRIRALRQAGEKLVEANDRLDEAERALNGPNGTGKLYQKQRALVARRWRLVGDLAEIFPIESAPEDPSNRREHPLLQIGDVPLDLGPAPSKTQSLTVEDLESDAAAYGHIAQICIQLAAILDVRLRYPVCPSLSRSYICDFHQVKPKAGSADAAAMKKTLTRIEFPLFMDSPSDRTKYTYGVFLLNKNLEQLLNAHGLSAVGPRHTLQNLKRIFDARRMIAADAKTHEIDE